MKTWLLVFGLMIAVSVPFAAFADYSWDFTSSSEGWSGKENDSWGMKGATAAWAPNGDGDGKMVITFDGNYETAAHPENADELITTDEFEPNLFMFFWDDGAQAWDETMDGNGGRTGRYCVIRAKFNGVQPTPYGPPEWGRLGIVVERGHDEGPTNNTVVSAQGMGVWTTIIVDCKDDLPDPATYVNIRLGTKADGSWKYFQTPGSTIEVDWVKFVDNPIPYLTWDFDSEVGPWLTNTHAAWGYVGFDSLTVDNGIMTATFGPADGGLYIPMLVNESVFLRSVDTSAMKKMSPVYLHMRCKVNCDPALESTRHSCCGTRAAALADPVAT